MRSVRTTFRVLEAVGEGQPIGLSELARKLELPKSTVQRSLTTLADLGWLRSQADDTRWRIGEKVRQLNERVDDLGRLREAALPALEELNTETLETIHLAVRDGDSVRLVERQDSQHDLRFVKTIGTRSPMHASSTGKAILARLPECELQAYLERGLAGLTERTLTDPGPLLQDLDTIRDQGFAVADQELTDGVVSVAAYIEIPGGPAAAVSISGPVSRMPEERWAEYGGKVVEAAKNISARLEA